MRTTTPSSSRCRPGLDAPPLVVLVVDDEVDEEVDEAGSEVPGRWSPGSWSARPPPARRRGRGPAAAAGHPAAWPGRRGRPGRPGGVCSLRAPRSGRWGAPEGLRRSLSRPWTPEACPRRCGPPPATAGAGPWRSPPPPRRPARGGRRPAPAGGGGGRPLAGQPAMAPIWHLALAARDPDPAAALAGLRRLGADADAAVAASLAARTAWPAPRAASPPSPTAPWSTGSSPPPAPPCCRRVTRWPGWWGRTRSGRRRSSTPTGPVLTRLPTLVVATAVKLVGAGVRAPGRARVRGRAPGRGGRGGRRPEVLSRRGRRGPAGLAARASRGGARSAAVALTPARSWSAAL